MVDTDNGPHRWRPMEAMPDGAESWGSAEYAERAERWHRLRRQLAGSPEASRFVDGWQTETYRLFAIETGQIENLYTLREGVTEELVATGFEAVQATHTWEGVPEKTLRGLLEDQQQAIEVLYADTATNEPLTLHRIRSWHQLLTRHQETVTGLRPDGQRVQVPFTEKGVWKLIPNNPRRADGLIHEYCPPEQVQSEMDRFIEFYEEVRGRGYPPEVEAAWLHHRFVRTHPFRDGNGRTARMLMTWAYARRYLPPPVIPAAEKPAYILALERADSGDLHSFVEYVVERARVSLGAAIRVAESAVQGHLERPNGNGGRTHGDRYYPPTSAS